MTAKRILSLAAIGALSWAFSAVAEDAGRWRPGPTFDDARPALGAAALGARIYIAGGAGLLSPSADVDIYDTRNGDWRSGPPLSGGRARFGMAALNDRIYVAGGAMEDADAVASVLVLDPNANAWSQIANMPAPRAGHVLVVHGGKLYALGGTSTAVDVYDPATDAWTRRAGASGLDRVAAAGAVAGGRIYFIGGRNGADASDRVDIYDPENDAWSSGARLPSSRSGHAAVAANARIHVFGGAQGGGRGALDEHLVLNAGGSSWATDPALPAPRTDMAAVVVNGEILLVGGGSGGGYLAPFTPVDSIDVFVPQG